MEVWSALFCFGTNRQTVNRVVFVCPPLRCCALSKLLTTKRGATDANCAATISGKYKGLLATTQGAEGLWIVGPNLYTFLTVIYFVPPASLS